MTAGEASMIKKPDLDGDEPPKSNHSMERKSLVFSVKKDSNFSMKVSPKAAKTVSFINEEDDNAIDEQVETNPHMRTNIF